MPNPDCAIPQNVSDPEHMERACGACKSVNELPNPNENHMIPIKILSATAAITCGKLYEYKVLFGESNCDKESVTAEDLNKDNCHLKENGNRVIYSVNVCVKLWLNSQTFYVDKFRNVQDDEQF